jgi:hypothetical protein
MIQEWVRVCRMEPDAKCQAMYAALALAFAELTRSLVDWQRALGGWNVRESQNILGWKREGKQEGWSRPNAKTSWLWSSSACKTLSPIPSAWRSRARTIWTP